jgi:hypothetical protein
MQQIKLICSDVDGTLLNEGTHTLHPDYYDTLRALKKQGIVFAACSGRQAVSLERLFEPLGEDVWYIAENGAYVGTYGRQLYANTLEPALYEALIDSAEKFEEVTGIMVSSNRTAYMTDQNQKLISWIQDGYGYQLEIVDSIHRLPHPVIKVALYIPAGRTALERVQKELQKQWGKQLKIVSSGDIWIDVMNYGISKGVAVQKLQEEFQTCPEHTMAFGDQQNDVTMLEQAKYSYAVAQAVPEAVAAANFRCGGPEELGVLQELRKLLK